MVSYLYTITIAGKIFNLKETVKGLGFDVGTNNMTLILEFKCAPTEHVITGNLDIVKDQKLRELIQKWPSFREQNDINWDLNIKICKEAIKINKSKWAKQEYAAKQNHNTVVAPVL